MSWDYFLDREGEISREVILQYRESLSTSKKSYSGRDLNRKTEEARRRLREKLYSGINGDPSRLLSTQLLDDVTLWWFGDSPRKEDARHETYMPLAQEKLVISEPGKLCEGIDLRPNFTHMPSSHWLGLEVKFEFLTPWYSKDDRLFHLLENPVRKDRVFGVPFMAAASWKGLLRWACRMQAGLMQHVAEGKRFEEWKDPDWILHLFGSEKGKRSDFHQAALVFYPTWFDKIAFEAINPHNREHRAGTKPIYYEVVPGRRSRRNNPNENGYEEGGKGVLQLLYAPWPGMKRAVKSDEVIPRLLEAMDVLLNTYGISAKRTVGWGTAQITKWKAFRNGHNPVESKDRSQLWEQIQGWFSGGHAP